MDNRCPSCKNKLATWNHLDRKICPKCKVSLELNLHQAEHKTKKAFFVINIAGLPILSLRFIAGVNKLTDIMMLVWISMQIGLLIYYYSMAKSIPKNWPRYILPRKAHDN